MHEILKAFPKVELHVHVEACVSADMIEKLAEQFDEPMLRPKDKLFEYTSLAEFLATYEWWCNLFRSEDFAESLAYETARMMHSDGIIYADVLCGPKYWNRLDYVPLVRTLDAGFERANHDGFTDCRVVPSISREQPVEWSMELLDWIKSAKLKRVVGLGLDGYEALLGRTCQKFEGVYRRAAEMGLGLTAHSGESSGPEGVWDAINYLCLDRIDHGVRAFEDEALVERLAEDQTTLNICPTSNVITGLFRKTADCPIGPFLDAGVPVMVNSDDPIAMNIKLSEEFKNVVGDLKWNLKTVASITHSAISAAFCSDDTKDDLRREVNTYMEEHPAVIPI